MAAESGQRPTQRERLISLKSESLSDDRAPKNQDRSAAHFDHLGHPARSGAPAREAADISLSLSTSIIHPHSAAVAFELFKLARSPTRRSRGGMPLLM